MKRSAFSLLEIIIATAVLAASAMVLSSLIGLGSRYGNRAEERTIALSQAESLLDEFMAGLGNDEKGGNRLEEVTGELPGPPPRSFRISATPFGLGDANTNQVDQSPGGQNSGGLLRVTVEVFESAGLNASSEAKSLIELSRLIRQPQQPAGLISNGMLQDATQGTAPALQGAFP